MGWGLLLSIGGGGGGGSYISNLIGVTYMIVYNIYMYIYMYMCNMYPVVHSLHIQVLCSTIHMLKCELAAICTYDCTLFLCHELIHGVTLLELSPHEF